MWKTQVDLDAANATAPRAYAQSTVNIELISTAQILVQSAEPPLEWGSEAVFRRVSHRVFHSVCGSFP